jgi:hypothetical protein
MSSGDRKECIIGTEAALWTNAGGFIGFLVSLH